MSKPVSYQFTVKYDLKELPVQFILRAEEFSTFEYKSGNNLTSYTLGATYKFEKFSWIRVNYIIRNAGDNFTGGIIPQETKAQGVQIGDLLMIQTIFKF